MIKCKILPGSWVVIYLSGVLLFLFFSLSSQVPHNLQRGDSLFFTIDTSGSSSRKASNKVGGVCISELTIYNTPVEQNTGKFNVPLQGVKMIRDLKLPATRVYSLHNEQSIKIDVFTALDNMHTISDTFGIPEENIVLELNNHRSDLIPASEWAKAARYCLSKGYRFRYWEVANEPYYNLGLYKDPATYVEYLKQVHDSVKSVDPEAKIILSAFQTTVNNDWREGIIRDAAGYYDAINIHPYNAGRQLEVNQNIESYEDFVLANSWLMAEKYYEIEDLIDLYSPDAYIYETEWAMNRKPANPIPPQQTADWQLVNSSLAGTMHRIVRMMYYAQMDFVEAASAWTLFAYVPDRLGFGLVPRYDYSKTTMLYWAYYYFNRHIGSRLVQVDGVSPYYKGKYNNASWPYNPNDLTRQEGPLVPVLATMNEEGTELYLIMVNGSNDQEISGTFRYSGSGSPGLLSSVILTSPQVDTYPLLAFKENFVDTSFEAVFSGRDCFITLPKRSAVFLKLQIREDQDGDGYADVDDAFPLDDEEWVDTDLDGIGNNADPDDDGDGVSDEEDAFPLDDEEWVDTDLDGIGNNADPDDDGDGVSDEEDAFPLDDEEWVDTDLDGIGNNADPDDDGDGVSDEEDAFPLDEEEWVDTDLDGIGNNADPDDDGDGVSDEEDPDPLDPLITGMFSNFSSAGGKKMKVYPNPAKDQVYLQLEEDFVQGEVEIADLSGKVLQQSKVYGGINRITTDHVPEGIYILKLKCKDFCQSVLVNIKDR